MQFVRTLPSELSSWIHQSPKKNLKEVNFDGFAFCDRVTNHTFQYRQINAEKSCERNTENLQTNDPKDSMSVYRFAKSFQAECLRSQYFRKSQTKNLKRKPSKPTSLNHAQGQMMSKQALFQINKKEMKRVLQTNDNVDADILQMNKTTYLPTKPRKERKSKRMSSQWNFFNLDDQENLPPNDSQRKIAEKVINHMKNQIKNNCEYLLSMPIEKKKKAMFNSQLKKHKQSKTFAFPKFTHSDLDHCKMVKCQNQGIISCQKGVCRQSKPDPPIIALVRQGFISEVLLQLTNDPSVWNAKDESQNNIMHVTAKEGNVAMMETLMKVLSVRNCLQLLSGRNNMKRTPKDKARMHGNFGIVALLEEFCKENQHFF